MSGGLTGRMDGTIKVLLIEDDEDYALLEREALDEIGGFEVETAISAADARKRRWSGYDVIILDHRLPDAREFELLREIVEGCDTPVIVLTGENVVKTAVEALKAGAYSYLVKDASNLELLPELLRQASREAKLRRERKAMADQMRRAEKLAALGVLAGGLCHEMNNPLTAILGYPELYLKGLESDAAKCMEAISSAGKRLRDVVRALAEFAAQGELPMEPVDLVTVVREVLEKKAKEFCALGVQVLTELPPEGLAIIGNRPGLEQVLHHLIKNALQAMEKSAEKVLSVRCYSSGGKVHLEVEDTGRGVPPGIRERIFEPFFTTRDPGEGMGMGLPISHRIVEAHGGKIWYEPTERGGARFVVELPH